MAWYNEARVAQPGSVILNDWLARRQASRSAQAAPVPRRPSVRAFVAGQTTRLTAGFVATNTSIDSDLAGGLDAIRARSRAQSQNNAYGAKFIKMARNNIVGPSGFTLQSRAADLKFTKEGPKVIPDRLANRAIEAAFAAWSAKGVCDITGQNSFRGICNLFVGAVAGDGEFLARRIRGKDVNAYGYALQILDIDRLQVSDNRRLANGNIVRMGVELDSRCRPVAYWLRTQHPGETGPGAQAGTTVERVPAAEIFHCFRPIRPEQRRGVPWMHPAMQDLYHLGEFDQSALVAARKGADTLGFFVSPDGSPPPIGDSIDDNGNPIEVSVPGTWDTLPEGFDVRSFDSKYPNDVYAVFAKACLRRIASGWGVAYNALGNDLEGVNFSSIRAGTLEERDNWMDAQEWMIEEFLIPVFEDWLEMALLNGAIVMENGSALPAAKIQKFSVHTWQGRRWQWVDPLKDIESAIAAIEAGLDSPQRIAAQQGRDIEDVLDDIAAFQAMAKEKNVEFGPPNLPKPAQADPAIDGQLPAAQ